MDHLQNQTPQSQNAAGNAPVFRNNGFQPAPNIISSPDQSAAERPGHRNPTPVNRDIPVNTEEETAASAPSFMPSFAAPAEEPENRVETQYLENADDYRAGETAQRVEAWQDPYSDLPQEQLYASREASDYSYREVPVYTEAEALQDYAAGEEPFYASVEEPVYENAEVPVNAAPGSKPKKKRSYKLLKAVAWVLVIAVAVSIGCVMTARQLNAYWGNRVEEMHYAFGQDIAALQQQIRDMEEQSPLVIGSSIAPGEALSPSQVYAMNVRSVVMIRSSNRLSYATGSGFILSADGYVVTNHHVIEGGTEFAVITSDGTEYAAELIGSDNTNDVALLKVEAQGLQAVVLGSSGELVVGDQVAAIGNPLGELTSTLTVGYVSAMERDVNTEGFAINMLQTDAAINSGNSGGPLFNMRGEVVGITTAKYSGTSSSGATIEGVGFAIPIDDVKDLLSDLAAYGYVTGAYMGVRVSDMDPEAASYYGLPVGAYVQDTEPDGPARQAGIVSKDIIVKVGDYDVRTVNDLTRALRNYKAGDTVTVVIYRGGGELKVVVTLTEKPAS